MTGGVPPIRSPLTQADDNLNRDWSVFFAFLGQMATTGSGIVRSGTRVTRLALDQSKIPDNSIFFEDTGLVYQSLINVSTNARYWRYRSGIQSVSQASIPTGFTEFDDGARIFVNDFHHTLWWVGSGLNWDWAPEDDLRAGEGPIFREVDPSPTIGWHLYDGTANVPYLKADGTLGTKTLPDLTTPVFMEAGLSNAGPTAAVAPTVSTTPTVAAAATGITNPATTGSASAVIGANSGGAVQIGAGAATAAPSGHTHTDSGHAHTIAAPTDPTHTHSLTGSITLNADGTPRSMTRKSWFRQ